MNTTNLKRFAQETRRKLLEQVGSRLNFILNADTVLLREKIGQIKQLREELNRTPREQLIEKVAYTWFNRLMALRYMDANDYQPLGVRIITPKDGYSIPELLDETKKGNIPKELKINSKRVFDLLDNRIKSSNPQNEAYKELLIAACNHLNSILPFLFERINDYTELLLPEDLTSDFSVVTDIRNGMLTEDCKFVEIIGWLYQFYVSEKKDEVFASKTKVKKEDIPAVTQLFTPRWIVEYMVQNTIGKLWIQNRPNSNLREFMPYFIESPSMTSMDYLKVTTPEEIRFLDPASGSGHILVYAYELFTKIYEEEGYDPNDVPRLIIEKNLFGYELDERAAQLSGFAIMMKARENHRRIFRYNVQPNILLFRDLLLNDSETKETFNSLKITISEKLFHDLREMQQATNFGSLIIPQTSQQEINRVIDQLNQGAINSNLFDSTTFETIRLSLQQLQFLTKRYQCIAANPPYMGSGSMNEILSDFVKINYPDSKTDLMACFIECGLRMLDEKGYLGMINQHSWMFLSSYEGLRKKLIQDIFFDTLLHLGARTFPEIGGEVVQNAAFTFWKRTFDNKGIYIKLVDIDKPELKRDKTLEAIKNISCGFMYIANQKSFNKLPSSPIAYWMNDFVIEIFNQNDSLGEISPVRKGNSTSNNNRFIRLWYETENEKNAFYYRSTGEVKQNSKRWIPYNKGGGYRKWYGFQEYLIDWKDDAKEIRAIPTSVVTNEKYYMKKGLTWSTVTSGKISIRLFNEGFIFDNGGCCIFIDEEELRYYLIALLNSNTFDYILAGINPTLNYQSGEVSKFPVKLELSNKSVISAASVCVEISVIDYDAHEGSWNFKTNELIRIKATENVDFNESLDLYCQYFKNKFIQLHKNEEEINRSFITIYGLQNELTPMVKLEDITILHDEIDTKGLVKLNNKLIRDSETFFVKNYDQISLPFNVDVVISQFISFAVGCMFGRYSLDEDGLILANQGESIIEYLQKLGKSKSEVRFLPDEDNIIPILEDEWFEDDITSRFHQFLKLTFGEKNFNKNLTFIEEQLGIEIRKYFIKDFYPDHIKRYKKRPIYWMFSSANGSFNVLIYMHRYTPDTVNNILNKYLREFINKLKTRKEHLSHVAEVGSPTEKTRAIREMDSNEKILIELRDYERDILYPLAIERISIDLDDGVLVNYNKFGKAVKEVAGLNDKKTKEAVKKFDWIDTSQIR